MKPFFAPFRCPPTTLQRASIWRIAPLFVVLLPAFARAQSASDFTTSVSNGQVTITGYTGSITAVVIPGTINGLPVTAIGASAFVRLTTLTSVSIPNSVTTIGNGAFNSCTSLSSVTIPNGVTTIVDFAFYDCTSLGGVAIPGSVTSIGAYVFDGCASLTSITVDAQNSSYFSMDGVLLNENQTTLVRYPAGKTASSFTIPSGVTVIGQDAFESCSSLVSVTIPNSVTLIGDGAFASCTGLTSATIPNSVTTIGNGAYVNCTSLLSVAIPNGVTSIGYEAFGICTNLTSVTIPVSVTTIGNGAFYDCTSLISISVAAQNTAYISVNDVLFDKSQATLIQYPARKPGSSYAIPSGVIAIGYGGFLDSTGLAGVTIPNSTTTIGSEAFSGCSSLTGVIIPNGVTTINSDAFGDCESLISLTIPTSVTTIGSGAFTACMSLVSVSIPGSVVSIGDDAFADCYSLSSVTIPSSVTTIGGYAFFECSNLGSVVIPNSVTAIKDHAFESCQHLTKAIFLGNAPALGSGVFDQAAAGFKVDYFQGATGFTSPTWNGYSSVSNGAPGITGYLNATGTYNTLFAGYTITPSSVATSFQATGLPAGLSLDGATGVISGTPMAAGSFQVGISATNPVGTGTNTLYLAIGKAFQTVTFPTIADQTYLGPPLTLGATASSGLAVTYNVAVGPATLSGNTLTFTGAGFVGVGASQAGNANYYAAVGAGETFYVNRATQTITFPAIADQTYLGPALMLSASSTSGLAVTYTVTAGPATVSGNTLTFTGAGAVTVKASQAGNGNYLAAADVSESFPVKSAAQKISFPAVVSGTVGKTVALAGTSSSGLKVSYSIVPTAGFTGMATISEAKIKFTGAGKIKLAADQAGNADYLPAAEVRQIVQVVGTQTISFPAVVSGTVGKTVTLAGTSSSGLKVSYSIVPTAGYTGMATISGAKIKFTSAGKIKLAADQAGNANYLPAVEVRENVVISP